MESKDYQTKFVCKRTVRGDTGVYTIRAVNESGSDTAEVHVTVLDRPATPEGPLSIADVHANGAKVSWKPPADDGGAEITHYVVEKQDLATGRWTNCGEPSGTELQVTDLVPGHEYKFRVKAVNRYGDSDPLSSEKPIVAKNPFDEPEKPGTPDVLDWDKDHVDLEWKPPQSDGGAPIEKYIIEKKGPYGDWEYAEEVPADKTKATVKGLKEGQAYQFRVKAVNKAGASVPSDPSRTVVAKARHVPPKIDRDMFKNLRVKAGQPLEFSVDVAGEPPPKIKWFLNGEPLSESDKTKIDNEQDYHTKLRTPLAERVDTGKYKIVATNESGTDEAEVEVEVLDVPGAPGGPLDVHDVHKEGASLRWNKPADDGGCPITGYVVEKQEDGGRWVECGETKDTAFDVTKLSPGHAYKFRVKAVNKMGQSKPLTTPHETIAKNPFDEPGKPLDVTPVDWDKDFVDLEWKPPLDDGGAPIHKYVIEKKDRFGEWSHALDVPDAECKARVPNLTKGETYMFRVKAVNKAGPGEPSDATNPVVCKPRRLAPKIGLGSLTDLRVKAGARVLLEVPFEGEPQPKVTWLLDGKPVPESDHHKETTTKENYTELKIPSSARSDTGVYTLVLENEFGTDKVSLPSLFLASTEQYSSSRMNGRVGPVEAELRSSWTEQTNQERVGGRLRICRWMAAKGTALKQQQSGPSGRWRIKESLLVVFFGLGLGGVGESFGVRGAWLRFVSWVETGGGRLNGGGRSGDGDGLVRFGSGGGELKGGSGSIGESDEDGIRQCAGGEFPRRLVHQSHRRSHHSQPPLLTLAHHHYSHQHRAHQTHQSRHPRSHRSFPFQAQSHQAPVVEAHRHSLPLFHSFSSFFYSPSQQQHAPHRIADL